MCGIFGIVSRGVISPDLLERAASNLAHRGPDDSGTQIIRCNDQQIGFAHTRLSIIDLSPLGHQPMHDSITGNWIVFNGEIYNFRELRRELEATGTKFISNSDTEVILAAYRVWGESSWKRFAGMFAFALWDAVSKRLLLVRDPLGIKPLYYHDAKPDFLFASEVRALLGTGLIERKINSVGLLSFLEFGSVYEPWTIVESVKAVPPGHVLTVENGVTNLREYANPLLVSLPTPGSLNPNSSSSASLQTLLRDAIVSHLVSDVPVGVFLSGGIDSSALVAVLSNNGVRPSTFSLVFQEEEFNEAPFSRQVAKRFNTDHHEIAISQQDALDILPNALRAMDQPTIDGINTYLVSAKARAADVKVALTGLGADEIFAGYSNFHRVPKMERFARRVGKIPAFARWPLAASVATLTGKNDRGRKLTELATLQDDALHPYFLARMLFSAGESESLFAKSRVAGQSYEATQQSLTQFLQESVSDSEPLDPVNRVSYLESNFYMRNTLLRDADFMSMAHGLELRVPFLDCALVEACFRIPGRKKLKNNSPKSLLLENLGVDLPDEIVHRSKRGFTLPFERWLRGEMKPVVEKALTENNGNCVFNANAGRAVWDRFLSRKTSWSRPWSLFVLQKWCERNL